MLVKTKALWDGFNGTILAELFRARLGESFYESVERLWADLDAWLYHGNSGRPHLGCRNQGCRPIETISLFVG